MQITNVHKIQFTKIVLTGRGLGHYGNGPLVKVEMGHSCESRLALCYMVYKYSI